MVTRRDAGTSGRSHPPTSPSKPPSRLVHTLRRLDLVQPRVTSEVSVRTRRGGALSLAAVVLAIAVSARDLRRWLWTNPAGTDERLTVDVELDRKLPIEFDMTFHALSCADVELVAMDSAGEVHLDMTAEVFKTRVDSKGRPVGGDAFPAGVNRDKLGLRERHATLAVPSGECGSCYGAETRPGDCCRTCHEVKMRYAAKGWDAFAIAREAVQCLREMNHPEIAVTPGEGCRLSAQLEVSKVAGNFHVNLGVTRQEGTGESTMFVHTFQVDKLGAFDTSHTIHRLAFGDFVAVRTANESMELDGVQTLVDQEQGQTAAVQYFIKLHPTLEASDRVVHYRYSVTPSYVGIWDPVHSKEVAIPAGDQHAPGGNGAVAPKRHLPQAMTILPGVYFVYDFSPFLVVRTPRFFSLVDVFVDLFAVAGGFLAIAKLVDAALHFFGL